MRVLLSTIGTRGEVQPLVALALQLRALGQEVRVSAPPDFREWIDGLGFPVVTIGPELRRWAAASPPGAPTRPSSERLRQLAADSVADQFATIAEAARGCDALVAGGALQVAARSITETLGIAYVYVSYCPTTLPSPEHAPPVLGLLGDIPTQEARDNRALWARDAQRFRDRFGAPLNAHRTAAGLPEVSDVQSQVFTGRPWLAADPTLAPWPETEGIDVVQTGAWILPDERPLSPELETFLDTGEPPVYLGFGSIRAPTGLAQVMAHVARSLGRRVIVSRGWADLSLMDNGLDSISIGEVNQQALFRRVAAVVHHGGAGTTTAAALAGAPQVILPQMYDQFYWAQRIAHLGIGTAHPPVTPTNDSLASALSRALEPDVGARARSIAAAVRTDGAKAAAQRLISAHDREST